MKPDTDHTGKHHFYRRLFYFPAFLFFCTSLYPQETSKKDSLTKVACDFRIISFENLQVSLSGSDISASTRPIPPSGSDEYKTLIFLDSLKSKASRTLITRKLYDFVIIPPQTGTVKKITRPSDVGFVNYSGMKIRKIVLRRLNVFGSYINSPDYYNPSKLERLLNKTHANTNENIIRKNLLFHEGDTISPLAFSDNERHLRQLPYIDDARIVIVPVSDSEADVIVVTKDIYSLGGKFGFSGFDKGSLSLFERNIFGMGHEFGIEIPYDSKFNDSPGFGVNYKINNILKSFSNLNIYYIDGLGRKTYGFDLSRPLVSSSTKYAGGISVREMFTSDDLDSLAVPASVKYNLQDYWLLRSFLISRESVARLILGARYTNNNVFDHPFILPESFHYLQKYKMFLGSVSFSVQKYYKASLIYGYGRTEDIPYGGLLNLTFAKETNEFKNRFYLSSSLSVGESVTNLGYFYASARFGTFFNKGHTEQGIFSLKGNFLSNLSYLGRSRLRNFVNIDYTRGFDRYTDEYLTFNKENGFSGFSNDSTGNSQRFSISIESVIFSPVKFYGFRFAAFGYADIGFLFGTNDFVGSGDILSSIGFGIRIRNDNLVLNTLQIRFGVFPNLPEYSRINQLVISGEQLLRPNNFDPGPPSLIPFK
jgi:hypothetical protein